MRDYEITDYLHGECMVLAMTLMNKYGWSPVGVYDAVWDTVPRHVGVVKPDGSYADARGAHLDKAAFLAGFSAAGTRIAPITPEEIKRIWGHRVHDWTVPDEALLAMHLI